MTNPPVVKHVKQYELNTQHLEMLVNGECEEIFIPESDYGLAEIYYNKQTNEFSLYGIPMYGGNPTLSGTFKIPEEVVQEVQSWT